jgi:hypothetical protein
VVFLCPLRLTLEKQKAVEDTAKREYEQAKKRPGFWQ